MSNVIAWIAAEAEPPLPGSAGLPRRARDRIRDLRVRELEEKRQAESHPARLPVELPAHLTAHLPAHLPAHQFPAPFPLPANIAEDGPTGAAQIELDEQHEREQRIYRGRTVGMLRRYLRYSIEAGRLPSLLGSEFFRAKVTAYTVVTFEDRVIFVHDMEKCLDRLDDFSRQLIARHILQEHDRWATAKLLHCNEKTVRRYTPVVLDLLSEILMEVGLMKRIESNEKNSCQEGESDQIFASDCDDEEYKV
jgi:hypothetical protein